MSWISITRYEGDHVLSISGPGPVVFGLWDQNYCREGRLRHPDGTVSKIGHGYEREVMREIDAAIARWEAYCRPLEIDPTTTKD
jgi:hypothetical protein